MSLAAIFLNLLNQLMFIFGKSPPLEWNTTKFVLFTHYAYMRTSPVISIGVVS